MPRRTTHRSSTGTKLYAVRDAGGKFNDIQTFQRSHAADLRTISAAEAAVAAARGEPDAATKKAAKKSVKKKVAKKPKKSSRK